MDKIIRKRKNIALVGHDNQKDELLEWVKFNRGTLSKHKLYATGTTGTLIEEALDIHINKMQSGPLGGDLQLGALIADGKIDFLVFFWDPLEAQPHDPDIKALLRIAAVWNIPLACNRATADFIISSDLMNEDYTRTIADYEAYKNRLKK
jgi:methylglyoxal synthase